MTIKWDHVKPHTVSYEVGHADKLEEDYPDWPSDDGGHDYGYTFEATLNHRQYAESFNIDISFRDCDPEHSKAFAEEVLALTRKFFCDDPRTYDWSKRDVEAYSRTNTTKEGEKWPN